MKQFYIFPCEKLILFLFQVTMRKNTNISSGTEMQNIKSGELWILYVYTLLKIVLKETLQHRTIEAGRWSSLTALIKVRSTRAASSELCPVGFGIAPGMEIPPSLWATSSCVWHPGSKKGFSYV